MRVLLIALLVGPLAGADFEPWRGADFENARIRDVETEEIYPNGRPQSLLRLPLTLVLLDKTNWTESRVLRHLRKTAAIFEPCGIALGTVRLARVRAPFHDVDMKMLVAGATLPRDIVSLSARVPQSAARPLIFFVGRLDGDSALARSYQTGDVAESELARYPYMNTAWIAYKTHWIERSDMGYSSPAHELAHLLCKCGHTESGERHLLHSRRNLLGPEILPQDCRRMKDNVAAILGSR